MKQYLDLVNHIISDGTVKPSGRNNMPDTIFVPSYVIKHNLQDGFPLLTTKKMFWKGVVHELLWFLRGETNIKYLVENGVNIWNGDAYRWYQKHCNDNNIEIRYCTIESFINVIKQLKNYHINDQKQLSFLVDIDLFNYDDLKHFNELSEVGYVMGDLGKVYGYQWRKQNGIDQVKDIIDGLISNPFSRYHILDGWSKSDFNEMALPPCHVLYHFIVEPAHKNHKKLLNLNLYQRSCDVGLGLPFNLMSLALMLTIISKTVNMTPNIITWFGGDTHIYLPHVNKLKEQTNRKPYQLPTMVINKDLSSLKDIELLTIDDFELLNYVSHPRIEMELFTGYKKM